jgi:hypothetical protein
VDDIDFWERKVMIGAERGRVQLCLVAKAKDGQEVGDGDVVKRLVEDKKYL